MPALDGPSVKTIRRIDHKCVEFLFSKHGLERIGELDLATYSGLHIFEKLHHTRREQITPEHSEIGGRLIERRLFNQLVNLLNARLDLCSSDDTETAHLFIRHRHNGDDRRSTVIIRNFLHGRKHLVIRHKHIA